MVKFLVEIQLRKMKHGSGCGQLKPQKGTAQGRPFPFGVIVEKPGIRAARILKKTTRKQHIYWAVPVSSGNKCWQ